MSDPRTVIRLTSLQARLHVRARDLQAAETTIHELKLERLARDRHICELKTRLWALETVALGAQSPSAPASRRIAEDAELERVRMELVTRAQELGLQDELVAAAEQERATYLAYIEHLETELAQARQQIPAEIPSIRAALSQAYALVRRAIRRPGAD